MRLKSPDRQMRLVVAESYLKYNIRALQTNLLCFYLQTVKLQRSQ